MYMYYWGGWQAAGLGYASSARPSRVADRGMVGWETNEKVGLTDTALGLAWG